MGRGKKAKKVTALGFYPTLPKTNAALGKYATVPGCFWAKCPAADKEKMFKCLITDFIPIHDFTKDGRELASK